MKIWAKTEEYKEGKFLVVRRDGSIPHWPHFVLGARDPFAFNALLAYANAVECNKANCDLEYVRSIRDLARDFIEYRSIHGNGDPFAPPHRKDDVAVITAMRGQCESIGIVVKPDKANMRKEKEATQKEGHIEVRLFLRTEKTTNQFLKTWYMSHVPREGESIIFYNKTYRIACVRWADKFVEIFVNE